MFFTDSHGYLVVVQHVPSTQLTRECWRISVPDLSGCHGVAMLPDTVEEVAQALVEDWQTKAEASGLVPPAITPFSHELSKQMLSGSLSIPDEKEETSDEKA